MENVNEKPTTILVKFNKKTVELDLESAKNYAQMGMKYEKLLPVITRLDFVAARDGMSFEEFAQKVCDQRDDDIKNEILGKVGGDEELAKLLIEKLGDKANKKREKLCLLNDENDNDFSKKLAQEFDDMRRKIKQFDSFDKLPKSIVETAKNEDICLYDATLRYLYDEKLKSDAEMSNREMNEAANVLPPKKDDADFDDGMVNAMRKGVKNGL